MKIVRFIISTSLAVTLTYFLNNSLQIGGTSIPPLGKFLDPFHGFWQNAEPVSGDGNTMKLNLAGLRETVHVKFDKYHVPHIFASNNEDLYFAQGYIIAMLRLWQMEFQTHAAAGRISELIGKRALNFDRMQRRKGMVHGAKNILAAMQQDSSLYILINKYAEGVNTYIHQLSYKDYPLEYKLLNYAPETWKPIKSALILEYMIDNLTGWDSDLENTNALGLFGKAQFNILFPDWIPGIEPVVPTDSVWGFDPLQVTKPDGISYPNMITGAVLDKPDPDNGSNNWAVSGAKTQSGKPILANDTHLGLNLPSLWVMMQLQSPDLNVYGFTFTGALGITIGFNAQSAWGFTNAPRDVRDWYHIQFENESKEKYWYDSAWRKTSSVIEEIKIKGEEAFYDTVFYTHHGPVVYDDNFMSNDNSENNYALKWIGHNASRTQRALHQLNRAKNYEEYRTAIDYWDSPPQNIVYACVNGDIGLTVQGNFPMKWPGQGKFLMDGSNPAMEWGQTIPKSHNAAQYNPSRNYVSSANQHAVDPDYPYYFYHGGLEFYRNRRINRLLDSMENITPKDFMHMHQDSYSIKAEEVLPILLDNVKNIEHAKASQYLTWLTEWDYHYKADSKAATVFNIWWKEFTDLLWDEFDDREMALMKPAEYNTTNIIKNFPDHPFIDIVSTNESETLSDVIALAYEKAIVWLEKWKERNNKEITWSNVKATSIMHLARLPQLSRLNLQVDGHDDAINSTKANHGPSQRLIVEMTSPPRAWGIIPGGQSGNPGSVFYDNFIDHWRDGKYVEFIYMTSPTSQDDAVTFTLQLSAENN